MLGPKGSARRAIKFGTATTGTDPARRVARTIDGLLATKVFNGGGEYQLVRARIYLHPRGWA
ncbi:hypothetical protein BLSMQ_1112 [Brevibacterium aurantiacum]|uniref:Uncharacterized protein n=1 Tax=Brevibacterium aurantiacum TaxID=273384 RepID=A0A1D7W1K8_BREAU|nr:hypothetical protein BLSMQ_1112 [Brevibacterium aurantiacum]GEB24748.1 hypothetical protein BAU01nite_34810 [Brevibacterium aurantiacum]